MGYVPPSAPPRLNLDRFGMPRDYATYVWLLYGRHVEDLSPGRRAFLNGRRSRLGEIFLAVLNDRGPIPASRDTR